MIEVNTSTEYWQKGASLVHTDPAGRHDAELPSTARVYMIAGTQHGGRSGTDPSPGSCVNPRNPPARPRRCVRSSWRSRNGSERVPRRRQVAFRRSHKAPLSRLKQSKYRQFRGLPFHQGRTELGNQSIGSNRRRGLTISTVHGSARSMLTATRSWCPAAADCCAARDLYWMERLSGTAWRALRPRRFADPVCSHEKRARSCWRSPPLARRTLLQPRYLCRPGGSRCRCPRR